MCVELEIQSLNQYKDHAYIIWLSIHSVIRHVTSTGNFLLKITFQHCHVKQSVVRDSFGENTLHSGKKKKKKKEIPSSTSSTHHDLNSYKKKQREPK